MRTGNALISEVANKKMKEKRKENFGDFLINFSIKKNLKGYIAKHFYFLKNS